jgi:hypothetical protein
MPSFSDKVLEELKAATFPVRRRARHRLQALANDALGAVGREGRFEEGYREQWRRIFARSPETLSAMPPPGAPRILFGSMFGAAHTTRPIDATLAMALRLRGATPIILDCDAGLPACEWNLFGNFEPDPGEHAPETFRFARELPCRACTIALAETHSLEGIEHRSLREFSVPGDVEHATAVAAGISLAELRDFRYRDLPAGEHAYASLLKGTLRGVPLDDAKTLWMARRYLASVVLMIERGERLFAHLRPDRFVASDGVYVTSAPLCALARKLGVHVIVHGKPYRKRTIWLSHHESYHRALINARNDRWERFEMSPERARVADDYLSSKHFNARDYTSFHVNATTEHGQIRAELGLDERPIVSLYTNILWDAQLYYRLNVYANMLEWLFETVRFFEGRPDLQLVIRLHPGEAPGAWPTNQPILPELERRFPRLPDNVKVVRPESKVSSYALGTMSRAALVYGARVGVELVVLGTPVIVAGEAFMRGKGFTYDPASAEEYVALLGRVAELERPSEAERERARRWYYYYFFRLMMPFPFYDADHSEAAVLSFASLDELLPGRAPGLDVACRGILDGESPFEWDEFDPPPAVVPIAPGDRARTG